jgi:hypothetical protein
MKHTTQLSIVLLATQKEYQSGDVTACLDKYFKTNASVDKKIDLHIFFNKGEENDYNNLLDYKNCENVNEVKIKSHKLEGADDLYIRTPEELDKSKLHEIPEMGGSAGPNNLFFNSMIPLMGGIYRDHLMIECDTYPVKDLWLDKIISYCDNNVFMIAGSSYKGKCEFPHFDTWTGHINGVAIYRASKNLSTFFEFAKKTIIHHNLYHKNPFMSFDVAMHYFSCTLLGRKFFNNRNLPSNQLIDSPIISNYSLPQDIDLTVEEVKKQNPETIILHKKLSLDEARTPFPVYYHIAKNAGTYVLSCTSFLLDKYLQLKDKEEGWTKIQADINFPSGNKCTVFVGMKEGKVNYWHDLKHHAKNAIANYTYLNSNLNSCSIDYLHELEYHAEIASQAYDQLDIGQTYPNNFKSEFSDLEYARKLRENAVTALKEKFPESKTYEEYKDNKKTILGQIAINSLIKEFPEANTLDFCKKLHKEIIPSEIKKITEQSFSPEEFISFIHSDELLVFAVLVEPRNSGSSFVESELIGWEDNLNFINQICIAHNRKPINFCTLREPFSRATSLFNYVKSSDSDHEFITEGSEVCDFFDIKSETFEEYIQTGELEDSWFIRQLLSLPYNQPITEESATLAINKLKDFKIKDIAQVDSLIEEIFSKSYNLSFLDLFKSNPDYSLNKHQSSKINTLKFDQLSPDLQQKFLDRTMWDKKVYKHFIK